jgi:DNA-binding transcriptional regulator YdaS (Cro superfamily)
MESDRIHCEILKRAVEIAGGEDKLARHLDVRSEDMHEWVQGIATARAGVCMIALDILSRGPSDERRVG